MSHTILNEVAEVFGVAVEELEGRARTKSICAARHAAMWALRERCPTLSLSEIGRIVGGRDHTTVMYGIAQAERRAKVDFDYGIQLHQLLMEPPPPTARPAPLLMPLIIEPRIERGELWWFLNSQRGRTQPRTA